MASGRMLLVGNYPGSLTALPGAVASESRNQWAADAIPIIHDAIARIYDGGFDAAVCWVEHPEELVAVVRIRKSMPDLPVLVLTPHDDEEFLGLARQAGATPFAGQSPDVSSVARTLCSALTAGDLATEVRERIATSHSLSHDISDLTKRARELTAEARSTLGKPRRSTRFLPLVVEDDADQAFLMVRAFEKADVFAPLPILRSAEEAIAYLDGKDPFEDRAKYPLPSVVLIDVKLAGTPGLELLGWIRKQPRFRRMAVIMLSDSSDMNYVNRAYQSGANSYLIKPSRFEALVELFHGLEFYWGNFNLGPDL